jgi:uncharacterized membrane protein YdjX (TVP38/TMEM64 family)
MKARTGAKLAVALLIVTALLSLRALPLSEWLAALNGWVAELGPAGLLLYAVVYALATVLLLPGSLLTLAAGAAFGLFSGFVSVWLGATLGLALAFLVSRHFARRRVEDWIRSKPRFKAVDRAIAQEGWKIVFLTRLSPVFPFNFQNYAYGLTRIAFWPYALASTVGIVPGTFLYVYLGSVGRSGLEAAAGENVQTLRLVLRIVGLVATVLVTLYITRIATRALKEAGV